MPNTLVKTLAKVKVGTSRTWPKLFSAAMPTPPIPISMREDEMKRVGKSTAYTRKWREIHRDAYCAQKRALRVKNHRHDAAYHRTLAGTPKEKVRRILRNGVHRGLVKKPDSCMECGKFTDRRRLHGHHPDYSKALEVEWLCSICHGRRHRK